MHRDLYKCTSGIIGYMHQEDASNKPIKTETEVKIDV